MHYKHPREDNFDRLIEAACYPYALRTECIKTIIATINPEWKADYSDRFNERYGITGIRLRDAKKVEPQATSAMLMHPERCIEITVQLFRVFYLQGLANASYIAGLKAYGLLPKDFLQHWDWFCNQPKQPHSYRPSEVPGTRIAQ